MKVHSMQLHALVTNEKLKENNEAQKVDAPLYIEVSLEAYHINLLQDQNNVCNEFAYKIHAKSKSKSLWKN